MSALLQRPRAGRADPEQMRHGVCEFLESMSREMCKMAYENGFDSLAVLFEMAREDANRIRCGSDEHCERFYVD